MSREEELLKALSDLTEDSGRKGQTKSKQQMVYDLMMEMSESEIATVKKQASAILEQREGKRRMLKERLQFSSSGEDQIDSMFKGLI